MSPLITRKSSDDSKSAEAAAPQGILLDPAGAPALRAAPLSSVVRTVTAAAHGRLPSVLPAFPQGLQDLGVAAALRITGPERESWLQGVQTNDLRCAPEGGAVEALFLGGKGRIVAEGLVFRYRDEIVVTTLADRLDALQAHLDGLLIMEDAEVSRALGLRRLRYMPGDRPPAAPGLDDAASSLPLGAELLVAEARAQELLASLPQRPAPEAVEALRVALGVPAWRRDFDERTTPLEAGLDRAISFTKGCYVGQEVVAMATYRGRVQWNLVRLEVKGPAPAAGSAIDPARGGKGRVTSAVQVGDFALLLGMVHRDKIVPEAKVQLEDGREATVLGLPFGSRPGAGVCV
jgi:folate-binding protein YgfZ